MQNFLINNLQLDAFLADRTKLELHATVNHVNPINNQETEYQVIYRRSAKGLSASLDNQSIQLDGPVLLEQLSISKPWGQELWFTGIEKRGESRVITTSEKRIPLSLYLSLAPDRLTNNQLPLLLKVLDPVPEEPLGNLYFEVHETKEEVYIVSHIDRGAWPGGVGEIRFAMSQEKRKRYKSDPEFRTAYLEAVKDYEVVRRKIDNHERVDPGLERTKKERMHEFTQIRQLRLGDTVRVPTWTPHSLQHGVRVVEFQTPTYERHIISFEQKVQTQEHWDSEEAIQRMNLEIPVEHTAEAISTGVDRVARFDTFNVVRADFDKIKSCSVSNASDYAICMAIGNNCYAGELTIPADSACLIPSVALKNCMIRGDTGSYALIAAPSL